MKVSPLFPRYLGMAKVILAAGKLPSLLLAANQKGRQQAKQLGGAVDDLSLLGRLTSAWLKGEYRSVSKPTVLAAVAALLYFISPLDAVPDWLLLVGLVDDIAVLALVVKSWGGELDQFRLWLAQRSMQEISALEVMGNR